jgi:hypothetical protein
MDNYLKYRDQMGNFDVLYCEHKSLWTRFIGHTAVIYKNDAGQLMVFESTSLNKFSGIKGVQLTPLGLWLSHYNGKVYWRKWVWAKDATRSLDAEIEFELFIQEHRGTSYPSGRKGAWLLFKAWWDSPFLKKFSRNAATTAVIFCSHLVGMLFNAVKFIDIRPSVPASELIPDDFRYDNYIDAITFEKMGHLAPEILIKG